MGLIFGLSLATAPWTLVMILATRESREDEAIIITVMITGHESDVLLSSSLSLLSLQVCLTLSVS